MAEQTNAQRGLRLEEIAADTAAQLTSAIISDSLDALGLRNQVLSHGLMPLDRDARALGRASTVQFAPTETDESDPYAEAMAFIDGLAAGSVAVIATSGDDRTAYWGELFSAAAIGRGAAGTVCDGPVRDTPKIRALGYPVFAAGARPIDFRARMRIVSAGEPVRCAGVVVAGGDVVMADADGVVVIPAAHEGPVLERAVARATAERGVLAELKAGARLREVWDRWGIL
jgi:regulator of RNase E activity RraA